MFFESSQLNKVDYICPEYNKQYFSLYILKSSYKTSVIIKVKY